jgi:hypothetical protein
LESQQRQSKLTDAAVSDDYDTRGPKLVPAEDVSAESYVRHLSVCRSGAQPKRQKTSFLGIAVARTDASSDLFFATLARRCLTAVR